MKKHINLFASMALFLSSPAFAAPFGFTMGQPISTLSIVEKKDNSVFVVRAPNPNAAFKTYMVWATKEDGLCKILALGDMNETDSFGDSVKSQFSKMKEFLSEKYGESKDFDFVKSGSLWEDEKYYSMALSRDERVLASFWDAGTNAHLPVDITAVNLAGKALQGSQTYITLKYELSNYDSCQRRFDDSLKGNL